MRLANYRIDVAQRRRLRGHYVDVDAKAAGVKSDWLLDAVGAIDRVERRVCVEDDLTIAVDRCLARSHQLVDVGLLNGMAAKFDLDIGDVADEAARAVARPNVLDGQAGHAL